MPCLTRQWAARLIAKSRFIGQYPARKREKAPIGSERETAMHGIGKSSIWTVAGFAFVSGLLLLQPTQAAAQFNIEGLIRGAIQQQGCCYGGGGYHYRSGSGSSRTAKSHKDDDSAPVDKTKEKDATQVESANNNGPGGRQQPAGPAQNPSRSVESDASTRQTSSSSGNDDQPAFSPSR
jgi:hypothetical protein